MKRIVVTLVLASLLQGCVGAFLAGAAVGGVVAYEGRNAHSKKNDLRLSQLAHKKLNADKELMLHSRVVISAYDGIVLLAGQAPTAELKSQAQDIVETVPGVRRVYNEITISGPISSLTQSSDTWITTKVKSMLLATQGLDSSQIKVVTENGTVYLLGKVSRGQSRIAADVARKVSGVQRVVTLFEYIQ